MGLIRELFKMLNETESLEEREERLEKEQFEDECEAYGLSDYAKEECEEYDITPRQWLKENEPELFEELDEDDDDDDWD